jgi:hypothetical protein
MPITQQQLARVNFAAYILWLEKQVITLRAAGDDDIGEQGVDDDDTAPHPGDKKPARS